MTPDLQTHVAMNGPDFVERPDLVPPVTRASITAAWLAAQAERDALTAQTGLRIDVDGHVVRRPAPRKAHV